MGYRNKKCPSCKEFMERIYRREATYKSDENQVCHYKNKWVSFAWFCHDCKVVILDTNQVVYKLKESEE